MKTPLNNTFPFGTGAHGDLWRREVLPFDGNCALSKGADLKLVFDDGSCLKTHVSLLSAESTKLKSMLECPESESLALNHTSRDAWTIILNLLHPKSAVTAVDLSISDAKLLDDVLQQTRKFEFVRVHAQMDRFFCDLTDNMKVGQLCERYDKSEHEEIAVASFPAIYKLPKSKVKLTSLAICACFSKQPLSSNSSDPQSGQIISKSKAAKEFLKSLFTQAPSEFVQDFVVVLVENDLFP